MVINQVGPPNPVENVQINAKENNELTKAPAQIAKDALTPPSSTSSVKGWKEKLWSFFGSKPQPAQTPPDDTLEDGLLTDDENDDPYYNTVPLNVPSGTINGSSDHQVVATSAQTTEAEPGFIVNSIGSVVNLYVKWRSSKIDKEGLIDKDKRKIAENSLSDPHLLELVKFISEVLVKSKSLKESIATLIDKKLPQLKDQKGLVVDLIELNIPHAIANLSELVNANKDNIPNYDNQSSLVNILSFLCMRGEKYLNREKFEAIEKGYFDAETELEAWIKKLLPDIETTPKQRDLINAYIRSDDDTEKFNIIAELFPDLFEEEDNYLFPSSASFEPTERELMVKEFKHCLNLLNRKHFDTDLKELFGLFADDLVECFFPDKKIAFPIFGIPSWIPTIYEWKIKAPLVNFLVTSYKPMVKNLSRNEAWEKTLKEHMGVEDLHTLLDAPTALVLGLTKDFIQTDPKAVAWVASKLTSMAVPTEESNPSNKPPKLTEKQKMENVKAQLSKASLANWIVESVQTLLHTEDERLSDFGKYLQDIFKDFTLGALAKGMAVVIPEGEKVDEYHFVEQLLEGVIAQFKALKGKPIDSEKFLKDFLNGLNLPPVLQNFIAGKLSVVANKCKEMLDKTYPEVEKLESDTIAIIKGYKNGDQLLSIIEKISDQMIGKALKKNIDWIGLLGLNDTVDEFLDQFLPGITIDEKLKEWFKENLKTLTTTENGISPQSVNLLKQGIQAVLGKAMINTIETNFKNDSDAYAAQLLKSVHAAFGNAFTDFNEEERKEISQAISIQREIESNKKEIKSKKSKIANKKKPKQLTEKQKEILEGEILAYSRSLRASSYVDTLKKKLLACLSQLDPIADDFPWEPEHLSDISKGIIKCEEHAETLNDPAKALRFRADIKTKIGKILEENDSDPNSESNRALVELEIFDALLEMDSDKFQIIRQALSTQDTIRHAEIELEMTKKELEDQRRLFHEMDMSEMTDQEREQWKAGIAWKEKTVKIRKEIDDLARKNDELMQDLDTHLGVFKDLSHELMALLGLETKMKLEDLPSLLSDFAWPLIEKATEELIPRQLFAHITNVLLPVLDLEDNRSKLKELSGDDEFYLTVSKNAAKEVINRMAEFVTSYKPFAEAILTIMGVKEPAEIKAIERMEKALQDAMTALGRKGVTASMLVPYLKDAVAFRLIPELKGIVPEGTEMAIAESAVKVINEPNFKNFTKEHFIPLITKKDETGEDALVEGTANELANDILNPFLKTISESLANLIAKPDFKEFTTDLILPILTENKEHLDKKEKKRFGIQAEKLVKDLNHFLLNRGKGVITNQDLLDTYRKQIQPDQPVIEAAAEAGVLKSLQDKELVKKIKAVLITPEEIAANLNDFIPGAEDLHLLVAPQLQEVIVGKDQTFVENRGLLQEYFEGMFLRIFIKILGGNIENGHSIFSVVARKLQELNPHEEDLIGKKPEEVARSMIDKALLEVFNLHSSKDYQGILLPLQKFAFEKTKEIAYQMVTPVFLPIVERAAKRKALDEQSGSTFLGSLSEAIAKDLFHELPSFFNSYRPIAAKTFKLLSGTQPTDIQLDEWFQVLITLIKKPEQANFNNQAIVQAYATMVKVELSQAEEEALEAKLKEKEIKERIKKIRISPEQVADLLHEKFPTIINADLRESLLKALQKIVHNHPESFKQASELFQNYVEGVLVQLFMHAAEKNPPEIGKDSFLVMIEKTLDLTAAKLESAKGEPFEKVAKDFNDDFFQKIWGINSPDSLGGLHPGLKPIIYETIKDKIGDLLIKIQKSLQALEDTNEEVIQAKEEMKQFGVAPNGKSNVELFSDDLAKLALTAPVAFREMRGEMSYGVNVISKVMESFLEELIHKKLEIGKLMLNYPKTAKLQARIGEDIKSIVDPEKHLESKGKAVELVSNWIALPINRFLKHAAELEATNGVDFDQKLIKNVLGVVTEHFRTVNKARGIAADKGRTGILHEDFVAAAGDQLHPGVLKKGVDYEKTLEEIFERLHLDHTKKAQVIDAKEKLRTVLVRLVAEENKGVKNLSTKELIAEINTIITEATGSGLTKTNRKSLAAIDAKGMSLKKILREEVNAPYMFRKRAFYGPEARGFLGVLFPKGKQDLTYIPEDQRGTVWKLYKENLFPSLLSLLTDLVFDPNTIKKMVYNALESTRLSMNQKVVLSPAAPAAPTGDAVDPLDDVSGQLMMEMLKMVKLPEWVKGKLIDPKTGDLYPAMKQSIGASLRKSFDGNLIKKSIEKGLERAVKRDPVTGAYSMQFDIRSKAEKDKEFVGKAQQLDKDMYRVTREVISSSIDYFIRKRWATAQARFDQIVEKAFGKIGGELKHALDCVFRFIFIKFIGTILSWLLSPLGGIIREKIYSYVALDQKIENVLDVFRKAPSEFSDGQLPYNEDLAFKLVGALHQTIAETKTE